MMKPLRDERGAIMLIAVFFAVFAVSMLYLGIGAGESVLFREHLQDAADSAALSGAITHARIMNMLVLLNVIMSVLLAILVALKLIEGIAVVGIALAAAAAWFTGGSTLAAIPPLNGLRNTMSNLYNEVKPTVFSALEILNTCATNLADIAPAASDAVVQADIGDSEVVSSGFAATTSKRLPVEADKYEKLCGKAGRMVIEIATIPLTGIPAVGEIMGLLKSPMETLNSSLSEWFCGEGENKLPQITQDVERAYPRTSKTVACEEARVDVEQGQEKYASNQECAAAESERAQAEAGETGDCQSNCEPGGPYDAAVSNARRFCAPGQNPAPYAYRFQTEEGKVDYTWNGETWIRGVPYEVFARVTTGENRPPCGGEANALDNFTFHSMSRAGSPFESLCRSWHEAHGAKGEYNLLVHPTDNPSLTLPVCTNECVPLPPAPKTPVGEVTTVNFRQVTNILGCKRKESVAVRMQNAEPAEKVKGNSKSPQRVKGNVKLGSEVFQLRAMMLGNTKSRESSRLVRLGLWGAEGPANPLGRLTNLGNFSFAQAEYYYDTDNAEEDRAGWMWNMDWRGRLTRFSMPTEDRAKDELGNTCHSHLAEDCDRVLSILEDWNELLMH